MVEFTVALDPSTEENIRETVKTQSLQPKFDIWKSTWNNACCHTIKKTGYKNVYEDLNQVFYQCYMDGVFCSLQIK